LGERDKTKVSDSDVLSTISFDKTGKFLAVGDNGGRVIIFKYSDVRNSRYFDYKYYAEIQAHEPDFDHLKSVELCEKVNALEFLHP
jgi:serine/threonine-protein phosphatase 2A regulatory subunit B